MFARFIFFLLVIIAFAVFALFLVTDIGLNNKKLQKKNKAKKINKKK